MKKRNVTNRARSIKIEKPIDTPPLELLQVIGHMSIILKSIDRLKFGQWLAIELDGFGVRATVKLRDKIHEKRPQEFSTRRLNTRLWVTRLASEKASELR